MNFYYAIEEITKALYFKVQYKFDIFFFLYAL